jgi:hypothetical protein
MTERFGVMLREAQVRLVDERASFTAWAVPG